MFRFATVLALGMCCVTTAVAKSVVTLPQVVEQAIAYYPSLQAAQERVEAGKFGLDSATGKRYPQINFSGKYGRERIDSPTTRSAGYSRRYMTPSENAITLSQSLFDGGTLKAGVDRAEAELVEQKAYLVRTREQLVYEVTSRYIDVLRENALFKAAKNNLNQHANITRLVRKRVDKKADSKASLYLVDGRLAVAKLQVERHLELSRRAAMELEKYTGKRNEKLAAIPPSVVSVKSQYNIESHPLIAMLHARQKAESYAALEKKGALSPKVNLEVVARHDNDLDGIKGLNQELGAYVSVSYNIFDSGAQRAAVGQAQKRHLASKSEYEEGILKVQTALNVAQSALRSARAEMRYFTAHKEELAKAKKAYRLQYLAASRTLFDLLNIQSEYFDANKSMIQAVYDEIQKAIDVKYEAATLTRSIEKL